jgi:phosphoribosyl 1,2-cyclic phosphodiesterase
MRVAGQCLIFDGGTGLRVLGQSLVQESSLQAHLFFTHSHWDRIQGFPFFQPAFINENSFDIYGAAAVNGASIKQCLMDQMIRPNFPVPLRLMKAKLTFHDIVPGDVIQVEEEITIETCALNRFDRALGYRVTWQNYSVVYATDVDCDQDSPDPALLYLAREADLLIYDAAQTPSEYASQGCDIVEQVPAWKTGIEGAKTAGVKRLALFHHDPCHSDAWLSAMEGEVQSLFQPCCFAQEGMVLHI